jgi:hypothetical protein
MVKFQYATGVEEELAILPSSLQGLATMVSVAIHIL